MLSLADQKPHFSHGEHLALEPLPTHKLASLSLFKTVALFGHRPVITSYLPKAKGIIPG